MKIEQGVFKRFPKGKVDPNNPYNSNKNNDNNSNNNYTKNKNDNKLKHNDNNNDINNGVMGNLFKGKFNKKASKKGAHIGAPGPDKSIEYDDDLSIAHDPIVPKNIYKIVSLCLLFYDFASLFIMYYSVLLSLCIVITMYCYYYVLLCVAIM